MATSIPAPNDDVEDREREIACAYCATLPDVDPSLCPNGDTCPYNGQGKKGSQTTWVDNLRKRPSSTPW